MRAFKMDLHIHTALSPCADADMTPWNIVQMAHMEGFSILAATDHNSSLNSLSLAQAAIGEMTVLHGMEVQTREEVHLLTLFPDHPTCQIWQEWVDDHLPQIANDPRLFGPQLILGPRDQVLGEYPWILKQSLTLSLNQVIEGCQQLGGLAIPAHIFRPSYSLRSQLGTIPWELPVAGWEITDLDPPGEIQGEPVLSNSDAHALCDLVRNKKGHTWLFAHEPTFSELHLALQGVGGRKVVIGPN